MMDEQHAAMVAALSKPGEVIQRDLTPHQAAIWHHATGIGTEAGEVLTTAKAYSIYGRPIDRENVIEELGDLEFYMHVDRATLLASSVQHIADVQKALRYLGQMIERAAVVHDFDKISDIDGFHADFITGFKETGWWDRHRGLNRHHLLQQDGIPDDINLIDILDFIADCTMAGMARSGEVYALNLPHEVLQKAFMNTCALLKAQIIVEHAENG